MLHLSDIMSGNEISLNSFLHSEAQTIPGDYIKCVCDGSTLII